MLHFFNDACIRCGWSDISLLYIKVLVWIVFRTYLSIVLKLILLLKSISILSPFWNRGYVGIHSSGFRDFLLKPELLRAIVDSGFEHPSEGKTKLVIYICILNCEGELIFSSLF